MSAYFAEPIFLNRWATTVYLLPTQAVSELSEYKRVRSEFSKKACRSDGLYMNAPSDFNANRFRDAFKDNLEKFGISYDRVSLIDECQLPIARIQWNIGGSEYNEHTLQGDIPFKFGIYSADHLLDMKISELNSIIDNIKYFDNLSANFIKSENGDKIMDYFVLKPSIFGIGIDINQIIKKLIMPNK